MNSHTKYVATLFWLGKDGKTTRERFAAWEHAMATRSAWIRASRLRRSGQASTYRIEHTSVFYGDDDFAVPAYVGGVS